MSDIVEGLGAVVEGSLAGRAVEPEGGTSAKSPAEYPPQDCANCGEVVTSSYCPACGQKRGVHRTLTAIAHDLIHGVLHLDGKFWKTLPLLVLKPGTLTRRYIDGERAKFVSPMAMFLFSVFAMFAVFQMIGLTAPTQLAMPDPAQIVREQGEAQAQSLREQIAALPASNGDSSNGASSSEASNSEEREQLAAELATIEGYLEREAKGELTSEEIVQDMRDASEAEGSPEASEFLDNLNGALFAEDASVEINLTGVDSIDQGILQKWRDNPGLMLYKLQANGYKFSWLLIPISLPFVWLVFAWRRRFKAYDHTIFVTYSLSFMSLLFIAVSVVGTLGAGPQWVVFPLMLVPPIHIYKQLRGTYELSRFSAFWRLMVLSLFIWIIILLFLQALLILGAF